MRVECLENLLAFFLFSWFEDNEELADGKFCHRDSDLFLGQLRNCSDRSFLGNGDSVSI